MSNTIGSMSVPMATLAERRNHYRVHAPITLRLRSVSGASAASTRDAVDPYEELVSASARYRKDLDAAGRAFIDRLLSTIDALIGQVNASAGADAWDIEREVEATISVTGLGFNWNSGPAMETVLEAEFAFAGDGSAVPFRATAEVVRSIKLDSGEWSVGLRFTEVSPATEQRLVRILYDMQRAELRQRADQS